MNKKSKKILNVWIGPKQKPFHFQHNVRERAKRLYGHKLLFGGGVTKTHDVSQVLGWFGTNINKNFHIIAFNTRYFTNNVESLWFAFVTVLSATADGNRTLIAMRWLKTISENRSVLPSATQPI